ncbi:unnamed protein product [Arabidopsis halleri]
MSSNFCASDMYFLWHFFSSVLLHKAYKGYLRIEKTKRF